MENVKLKDLSKTGVTDLLLNYYAFEIYDRKKVVSFISEASKLNIRVHILMQTFIKMENG